MAYRLSICLMEYNRANVIYKSVKTILKNTNPQLQVVVRDDSSTDNTMELLNTIQDCRLKVTSNETNIGAPLNWLYSLKDGEGDWLYLAMGRDIINPNNINDLIAKLDFLDDQNVGVARDVSGDSLRILSYEEGINYFLSFGEHPTGLIFKRASFATIKNPEAFFNIKGFVYPEVCLARDILISNRGAIINAGVYEGRLYIDLSQVKSGFKFEEDMFYFAPKARYIEFKTILSMTEDSNGNQMFDLNKKQADARFIFLFNQLLKHVSFIWADFLKNDILTNHYNIKKRRISKRELLTNVFLSYKTVIREYSYLNYIRKVKMIYWTFWIMVKIVFGD